MGRDVLLKGARWRVGSGDSISVWNDAWLLLTDHPRIQSEAVTDFEHMKVSKLIHPVSMQWDINLLNGLFSPQEVHLITSIPLGRIPTEDKYIWPYTSSGQYTVKSGSSFLVKDSASILPDTHATPDNGSWKLIRGLPIPNKVRNFLWRSCQDAIPVKKNLWWRQILFEDICDHSKQSSETVIHALWDCAALSGIWNSIPEFTSSQVRSFSTLCALFLFVHKEESRLNKMAMTMWTIWNRRNQIRTCQKDYPLS